MKDLNSCNVISGFTEIQFIFMSDSTQIPSSKLVKKERRFIKEKPAKSLDLNTNKK